MHDEINGTRARPLGTLGLEGLFQQGLCPAGELRRSGGAGDLIQRIDYGGGLGSGVGSLEQSAGHGQHRGGGFRAGRLIVEPRNNQRE